MQTFPSLLKQDHPAPAPTPAPETNWQCPRCMQLGCNEECPVLAPVVNIQTLEKKHLIYLAAVTLFSKGAHSGLSKEQTEALLTKSWNVAEVIYTAYEDTGRL